MEYNNEQVCVRSRNRTLGCRIELLNTNYNTVDYLQGKVTSGGITLTNNSNDNSNFSRLSGSLDMIVTKDLTTDYFKLDLKHLVRIIMIITDNISSLSSEFKLGIALLNSPQISKGVDGNSKISINLNDLMSNYDGVFGGALNHTVTIESSTTSSANMSQTLQDIAINSDLMGLDVSKVKFESNDFQLRQAVTCEGGNNITDLLKSLMELDMAYELFFNPDGILTYQRIRNYLTDTPIQEFINSPNIINYNIKNNFENAKNVITVLGAIQESADSTSVPYQYKWTSTLDDTTPNHPLSVKNIGVHKKVITNDNAQSDEQCKSQADYNLDKYSNYLQTLEIEMLPDFRLIPNRIIVVEYSDDNVTIENGKYLIDSVTFGLKPSDLTSITCHRLYSDVTN